MLHLESDGAVNLLRHRLRSDETTRFLHRTLETRIEYGLMQEINRIGIEALEGVI